jgi:hypothetical protein
VTVTSAEGGDGGHNVDADLKAAMQQARQALTAGGLPEVAERAWALMNATPQPPTLVVIGEVKRGKSLLVNALLGDADMSPVDVEIATSAFIRFIPVTGSACERDTALLFAGGTRKSIDVTELADWVTAPGRHVVDSTVAELPIGAEVAVHGKFLPGVTVVDTPGTGGLNPNHLVLARAASTSANILLMTCDATAPITAQELDFLKSVSAEVDSVLIAVTKIDKNYRHWRTIVSENHRLLREHAPRFADVPIVGVSSMQAVAALGIEPGERRDAAFRAPGAGRTPRADLRLGGQPVHGQWAAHRAVGAGPADEPARGAAVGDRRRSAGGGGADRRGPAAQGAQEERGDLARRTRARLERGATRDARIGRPPAR